jgi:hypothetical protein
VTDTKLIKLTDALMPADAMRLRIILDRANIPYHCFNELNFLVTAQGPIQFFVPDIFLDDALAKLETAFEVQLDNLPDFCPACGTETLGGIADCPACGLFLG